MFKLERECTTSLRYSSRVEDTVDVAANNDQVGESHPGEQTTSKSVFGSPEQNLRTSSISQVQAGGGGVSSSQLKNETVSRTAFASQDKVNSTFSNL
ncbi:hypothetical protein CK203_016522 [Vitis vinifera]|uniref:Uncharacterized protein n=1 Tax=Vitis vinifera TaxID=29760 RepID=A0A438J1F7_VITVI|nr:hypothetical protein CK203_016522 [Vitis vinifera]